MSARPERIAHRGASREFDENSLPAFARALERGADAVELDVHLSRDGAVIVHHDPDVTMPDGAKRAISGLTLSEIRECRLPRGASVPTLEEVFGLTGDRMTVYVEIKDPDAGEAAITVAREHGHHYAFHSFAHAAVLALRQRHRGLAFGALLDEGTPDPIRRIVSLPVRDIWAHWSLVDAALAATVHAKHQRLIVWTVNDEAIARRLIAVGSDGLCSDDVRLLPAN